MLLPGSLVRVLVLPAIIDDEWSTAMKVEAG